MISLRAELAMAVVVALASAAAASSPARAAPFRPEPTGFRPAALKVAIVNLATDSVVGAEAAAQIRRSLQSDTLLVPLESGALSRALEEELPSTSPAERAEAAAGRTLIAARAALSQFRYYDAKQALAQAKSTLLDVLPGPKTAPLLAEIAFEEGLVHLREQNRGLALDAFRACLQLAPSHPPLDPARYPPEVVTAFEEARGTSGPRGTLQVSNTFDGTTIYLDGVEIGKTPLAIEAAQGKHMIAAEADGFLYERREVSVSAAAPTRVAFDLPRLPTAERASDLRRRFLLASSDSGPLITSTARQVADLARVDAVVVITTDDHFMSPTRVPYDHPRARAAIYQRASNRLTLSRSVDGGVEGLLGILSPTPPPGPAFLGASPTERDDPWYRSEKGLLTLGGSAVAAIIITAVVVTLSIDDPAPYARNGVWAPFEP